MPFVDRLKEAILDSLTSDNADATTGWPNQLWLGLGTSTSDPTEDDSAATDYPDEVSATGTAYARQRILTTDWDAAQSAVVGTSTVSTGTNNDITFPEATGAGFGTVAWAILYDAETVGTGNIVAYGSVTNVAIAAGDQLRFQGGNITLQIS